jgi:delta 1-pyrroline-5-carboxylate dehydrogenase
LPGPTGERNLYQLLGKPRTLCLAQERTMLLLQLAAALACGSQALWVPGPLGTTVHGKLPEPLRRHVLLLPAELSVEEIAETEAMDSALLECDAPSFYAGRRPGKAPRPVDTAHTLCGRPARSAGTALA